MKIKILLEKETLNIPLILTKAMLQPTKLTKQIFLNKNKLNQRMNPMNKTLIKEPRVSFKVIKSKL